jgi:hypothetical protein
VHVVAVELMARLANAIAEMETHLSEMNELKLQMLEQKLPRNARAGSAEMVTLILIHREMEKRSRA